MKKLLFLVLFVIPLFAQNGRVYIKQASPMSPVDSTWTTYAKNQIDTVVWYREQGVTSISFSVHARDSVRFANDSGLVIQRLIDRTLLTKIAGDTLNFSSKISTTDGNAIPWSWTNGAVYIGTPTYAPYADAYLFIVKYGIAGCGTTTPYVKYSVHKIYGK